MQGPFVPEAETYEALGADLSVYCFESHEARAMRRTRSMTEAA